MANNPPRKVDIKGQPHMLAYITPEEGGILHLLGGSGKPGPMGIPSFYEQDADETGDYGDDDGFSGNGGSDRSSQVDSFSGDESGTYTGGDTYGS